MAVYQLPRFALHETDGQRCLVDTQTERAFSLPFDWSAADAAEVLAEVEARPGYFAQLRSAPAPRTMILEVWLDAASTVFSVTDVVDACERFAEADSRRAVA